MDDRRRTARAVVGGCCAIACAVGLGRFGYTALIPEIVRAGWMTGAEAAYAGAVNLTGYLIGAAFASRLRTRGAVRIALVVVVASLAASAPDLGAAWLVGWRLAGGIAGGVVVVLSPPLVLARVAPDQRGRAAGMLFVGIGTAIVLLSVLVPRLVAHGLCATWLALGGAASMLALAGALGVPEGTATRAATSAPVPRRAWWLVAAYTAAGVGFMPHTIFWVDYIARGLDLGIHAAARAWAAFGIAAALGPLVAGVLADRIGISRALRVAFLAQLVGVALPVISSHVAALTLSSVLVGAGALATPSLASARAGELAGPAHTRLWGRMTASYALVYAGGGYVASFAFERSGSYAMIFTIGAAAFALAMLLEKQR